MELLPSALPAFLAAISVQTLRLVQLARTVTTKLLPHLIFASHAHLVVVNAPPLLTALSYYQVSTRLREQLCHRLASLGAMYVPTVSSAPHASQKDGS